MNSGSESERAARVLVGAGSVKERLLHAWRQLADLQTADLPNELQNDFTVLQRRLQRERPMYGEDAVTATVRKLSGEDACRMAYDLLFLCFRLSRDTAADAPRTYASSASVIPLFAAEA